MRWYVHTLLLESVLQQKWILRDGDPGRGRGGVCYYDSVDRKPDGWQVAVLENRRYRDEEGQGET